MEQNTYKSYKDYHSKVVEECVSLTAERFRTVFEEMDFFSEYTKSIDPKDVAHEQIGDSDWETESK